MVTTGYVYNICGYLNRERIMKETITAQHPYNFCPEDVRPDVGVQPGIRLIPTEANGLRNGHMPVLLHPRAKTRSVRSPTRWQRVVLSACMH